MKKLTYTLILGLLCLNLNAQQTNLSTKQAEQEQLVFVLRDLFASYPILGDSIKVKDWLKNYADGSPFIPNGQFPMYYGGRMNYKFFSNGNNRFNHRLRNVLTYFMVGFNDLNPKKLTHLEFELDFETSEGRANFLRIILLRLGDGANDGEYPLGFDDIHRYNFNEGMLFVYAQKREKYTNLRCVFHVKEQFGGDAAIQKEWIPEVTETIKPSDFSWINDRDFYDIEQSRTERNRAVSQVKINRDTLQVHNTPQARMALSESLNSLGWYELLLGNFEAAEKAIKESIEMNKDNSFPYTNMPPILLFSGQLEQAERLYREWMSKPIDRQNSSYQTYREVFLNDFDSFKDAGMINEKNIQAVDKIRQILLNMPPIIEDYRRDDGMVFFKTTEMVSEMPPPNAKPQRIITTDYTPDGIYNCDNRCLLFNGKTDYLNFSEQPILGNMDFTIEAQISLPFGAIDPLSRGIAPENCGGQFKRIFSLSSGPSMRIELGHCGGNLTILLVGTGDDCFTQTIASLTSGTFHVALTRHKNELSVYSDGKRIFLKQNIKELNTKMTLIGGWQGMSEFYDGYIDELRIWTKGRSAEEISRNAYLSLTKGTGLVGSYNFDEGKPFGENQNISVPVNRAENPSNNLFFPKREDSWSRKADFSNFNCSYSRIHKPSDISLNPQSAKKYKNKGQEPDEVLALFIASLMRKDDVWKKYVQKNKEGEFRTLNLNTWTEKVDIEQFRTIDCYTAPNNHHVDVRVSYKIRSRILPSEFLENTHQFRLEKVDGVWKVTECPG